MAQEGAFGYVRPKEGHFVTLSRINRDLQKGNLRAELRETVISYFIKPVLLCALWEAESDTPKSKNCHY